MNWIKTLLFAAVVLLPQSCGHKEEQATGGPKDFTLTANLTGSATIFSNAGSAIREVNFNGSSVKVEFPGTSTRLIGVSPSLGMTEGRASSVRIEVPASQQQSENGIDHGQGLWHYCKADANKNPVRFDFQPMTATLAMTVSGPSTEKLKGVRFSNSATGIAGIATMDLYKSGKVTAIAGGGSEIALTLVGGHLLQTPASLFMHLASVNCKDVILKIITETGMYRVRLSKDLDCSAPGKTDLDINLSDYKVKINGVEDTGAIVSSSEAGDFSALLLLDDTETVDRIPDFSRVGYKYGDAAIPSPAVVATIDVAAIRTAISNGTAKDTTDLIQKTIDQAGANGGGAILFKNGTYNVGRILFVDSNNLVLRGESRDGTIIYSTTKAEAPVIYVGQCQKAADGEQSTESIAIISGRRVAVSTMKVNGTGGNSSYGTVVLKTYSPRYYGYTILSNSEIIEDYVPLGRLYVEVRNSRIFKPGDKVMVYRPATQKWLEDIGMDRIAANGRESMGAGTNQWDVSGYSMRWSRKVTAVSGNRVYLDAPIAQSIDSYYAKGQLEKYSWTRVSECGVENMTIDCAYDKTNIYKENEVDEQHAWNAVLIHCAENCWVRNVTSKHMGYALANMGVGARCITVENCSSLTPVSVVSGARRYAFCCSSGAELCLVKDCYCNNDRHAYVTNGTAIGPNVFTNCLSERGNAVLGPHWGWASATLYDCVKADTNFEVQDGGNQGAGHGWRGMATVLWNVETSASIVNQNAWATCKECGTQWNRTPLCRQCGAKVIPSGRNFAVGVIGTKSARTINWDRESYDGDPTTDFFVSLYGYGENRENRPDGEWYPERSYMSSGGTHISLPYDAPVDWWPRLTTTHFSKPLSLYQCQLEDRHARGIYLNTL